MKYLFINKDLDGEYRIPAPDGGEAGAAYTSDKEDALDTARAMHGDAITIVIHEEVETPDLDLPEDVKVLLVDVANTSIGPSKVCKGQLQMFRHRARRALGYATG